MIRLYVSPWCVECERAVELLEREGVPYEAVEVECCRLHELTGGASVPQAMADGRPLGGYAGLAAYVHARSGAAPMPAGEPSRIVEP